MVENKAEANEKDLNSLVALEAKKLFLLINSLPVQDEIKDMLLTMAENATFSELQAMIKFFEDQYANITTAGIDEKFLIEFDAIAKEHGKNMAKLDEDFANKLKEIENKL